MESVDSFWGRLGGCRLFHIYNGKWLNTSAFLGLAFPIHGHTHYEWAQVTVSCFNNCGWLTAKLTGYAYQTTAGKSILAGQK
jgi:hypothetical protein